MDHDVKRVVAAGVASIHVLLQQNYAWRTATNYPGCWKRLERRDDVARHRSCAVAGLHNIGCAIFIGGWVERIQQTQLDDADISSAVFFHDRHLSLSQKPGTLVHLPAQTDLRLKFLLEKLNGGLRPEDQTRDHDEPKIAAAGSNCRNAIGSGGLE